MTRYAVGIKFADGKAIWREQIADETTDSPLPMTTQQESAHLQRRYGVTDEQARQVIEIASQMSEHGMPTTADLLLSVAFAKG